MLKLKENYILNKNEDDTYTIFDLENDKYYEINEIGGIVLSNINDELSTIINKVADIYEDNENMVSDITMFYNEIKENFFEEE